MRTIAILNLKGGTAKTVTAATMARCLAADHGKRVLLIDADPQGNLSQYLGAEAGEGNSTWALLKGDGEPFWDEFISDTGETGISIVPANEDLAEADFSGGAISITAIRELVEVLNEDNAFDLCLIDCAPSLGRVTQAALLASDEVIIPIRLDLFSTAGMAKLRRQVDLMRRYNPALCVSGVLCTQFMGSFDERAAYVFLAEDVGLPVFKSRIRMSRPVIRSIDRHESLFKTSPNCGAARDYRAFVREYLERGAF